MKTFIMMTGLAIFSHPALATTHDIDAAANTMDIVELQNLASENQDYKQAYANYRLAVSANILGQKRLAAMSLVQSETTLRQMNQLEPDAENFALLASIYGMQISMDISQAQQLGTKYAAVLSQAKSLAPDNPRVKLIQAISAFNTPVAYGGSMEKAVSLSSEAITLFEQPCDHICWGHAEAYVWRGLAKQDLGNTEAAIADWQQALVVQDDYGWAKFLLRQQPQTTSSTQNE